MDSQTETPTGIEPFIKNELLKIFHPNHLSGGHGTGLEIAQQILEKGIRVNVAYGLPEITVPLGDQKSANLIQTRQLLTNWPHRNTSAVVIVCVPNKKEFLSPKSYVGTIFDKKTQKTRAYIPPQFIKGYFNSKQEEFINNPLWETDPEPLTTSANKLAHGNRPNSLISPKKTPAPNGTPSRQTTNIESV